MVIVVIVMTMIIMRSMSMMIMPVRVMPMSIVPVRIVAMPRGLGLGAAKQRDGTSDEERQEREKYD